MFTGEYNCVIDEKSRMAIPSAIRRSFDCGDTGRNLLYLTIGTDQCLYLYPEQQFKELVGRIKQLSLDDKKARNFQRIFFSNVHTIEQWDKQGRIVIPQKLKSYAMFDKETTVIGMVHMVELWDSKKWEDHKESVGDFNDISENIANIF